MGQMKQRNSKEYQSPRGKKEEESCRNQCWLLYFAGMGSRYGGLKQIDPVDQDGHIIMDFSIYDAKRAGFEKVVFIIKKRLKKNSKRVSGTESVSIWTYLYVYRNWIHFRMDFEVPKGRESRFGTGHAILSCKGS